MKLRPRGRARPRPDIAAKLKRLRAKGMTDEDVASELGVSFMSVRNWRAGKSISPDAAAAVEELYAKRFPIDGAAK